MCTALLPPCVNPIAIEKYISYIISYRIIYHITSSYHIVSYRIISNHIICHIIYYIIIYIYRIFWNWFYLLLDRLDVIPTFLCCNVHWMAGIRFKMWSCRMAIIWEIFAIQDVSVVVSAPVFRWLAVILLADMLCLFEWRVYVKEPV
jgi:hypothetical protein